MCRKQSDVPRRLEQAHVAAGLIPVDAINAGREAIAAYQKFGRVLAPTAMNFPFLPYVPEELTEDQITAIIDDFGKATQRAIDAGFDGVEIHGANHYLLQQFFSAYSNHRTDHWGGSLENRMHFPLAVLHKVKEVVTQHAQKDFIVGYRISPEEVHGENVGYTIDDSLQLIDRIVEDGVDYLHIAQFNYKAYPAKGGNKAIATLVKRTINGRTPLIVVGNIFSPREAVDAMQYGDIIAFGRNAIIEPLFAQKLYFDQEDQIETSVAGRLDDLALSQTLLDYWKAPNTILAPLKGLTY